MLQAVYDKIGKTYDATRKADEGILSDIISILRLPYGGKILDIGCGSGNYTVALKKCSYNMTGIDISFEMLYKARQKDSSINWILGDASRLPFANNQIDAALFMLSTHHIEDLQKSFSEAYRVARHKILIFTSQPSQMDRYWLKHYFPEMIEAGKNKMMNFAQIKTKLITAGFTNIKCKKFFVSSDLQDLFLQAGKYRPSMYLNQEVRDGISSFHQSSRPRELQQGLQDLEMDIESGKINEIITSYESDCGDYSFIVGTKPEDSYTCQ